MRGISDRDKKLLIILLLGLLAFLSYMFVYKPQMNNSADLKKEIETDYNNLRGYQNNKENVENFNKTKRELYKADELKFYELMPVNVWQEDMIRDILKKICTLPNGYEPVELKSISFQSAENGDQQSNSKDTNSIQEGLVKIKAVSIMISTSYKSFKEVLKNINDAKPKVIVENINITSNAASDEKGNKGNNANTLNISMSLNFYEYSSAPNLIDREQIQNHHYIPEKPSGKSNIFDTSSQAGMEPIVYADANNYDFYAILSPITSDWPALVTGIAASASKRISEGKNGINKLKFIYTKKDGKYYYNYSTDSMKYPIGKEFEEFSPKNGQAIVIKANGNDIIGSRDNVAVEIGVDNRTTLPVQVFIFDDDPIKRKIMVKGISGNVKEIIN